MSPTSPGVSVVVSAYNYRAFIAEAIDSALAQSRPPLEILVMDDGSSDGTAEFVRNHYAAEPRVQLRSRENRGQLACFIDGVQAARGALVAFLDADDRWQPDYLARVCAVYEQQPQIDFVYTNMRFFGSREGLFLRDTESRDLGLSILRCAWAAVWQGSATSALSLRRPLALELLRDIPETFLPKWKTRADDWLVYGGDVAGAHKYYLAEALVDYRAHGRNAWLDQGGYGAEALRHSLRVEMLLAHYRARAGLGADNRASGLRHLKHEFRTKPRPRFAELQVYLGLLGESSHPWAKRLEHRGAMWRHYLRPRSR